MEWVLELCRYLYRDRFAFECLYLTISDEELYEVVIERVALPTEFEPEKNESSLDEL